MDVIQKDLIALLKANASIISILTGDEAEDVREDQYQGRTFNYPAVRVDIQTQPPRNEHDQCDLSNLFMTIRCYTEGASSKASDILAGVVNGAFHRHQIAGTGYNIPRVRSAGLVGAKRLTENIWVAIAPFTGNIYPTAPVNP